MLAWRNIAITGPGATESCPEIDSSIRKSCRTAPRRLLAHQTWIGQASLRIFARSRPNPALNHDIVSRANPTTSTPKKTKPKASMRSVMAGLRVASQRRASISIATGITIGARAIMAMTIRMERGIVTRRRRTTTVRDSGVKSMSGEVSAMSQQPKGWPRRSRIGGRCDYESGVAKPDGNGFAL